MTKKELKSIINECIEERFNNINSINEDTELEIIEEDYINISEELQSLLESNGYGKEDLKDPNKVLKLCNAINDDKNKTTKSKVKEILEIIAAIILIIPTIILIPIWVPICIIIMNLKDKLSAKELEKSINKLKKQKAKLEKKLEKTKDEKEREAIKKAIAELDKTIAILEKEHEKAVKEKRFSEEYMFLRGALSIEKMISKNQCYEISDGYDIDIFCFSTYYLSLNDKNIEKAIYDNSDKMKDVYKDFLEDISIHERPEFLEWLEKNLGCKENEFIINSAIDDTITIYSPRTKKLYHGDYGVGWGEFYTFADLRKSGEKILNNPVYNFKEAEDSLDEIKNKRLSK